MTESKPSELVIQKSKLKECSGIITKELSGKYDISPYTEKQLSEIVLAGLRTGEIELCEKGKSLVLKDIDKWFKERLMPNTILLTEQEYKTALYRAFRLLVMGKIAMTDFGSSRQRDFGQRWTDFTRGFLGEIGTEKFFKEKMSAIVKIEEKEVGEVESFLPTDITQIQEKGKWRDVNTDISIKTSKLGSMWLDIGTQIGHSDAFIFIKIGLTVDHLIHFFKNNGFLKELVKMGKDINEVENIDKEFKELSEKIPTVKSFPAYISGFVWKSDLETGQLKIYETKSKNPTKKIIGGLGLFSEGIASSVEGLGDISPPKHLACISALRWTKEDWKDLKNKI